MNVKIPVDVLKRVVSELEEAHCYATDAALPASGIIRGALTTLREYIPKPRFFVAPEPPMWGVRCGGDPFSGYVAGNIPTREAAEEIAAIYERENA